MKYNRILSLILKNYSSAQFVSLCSAKYLRITAISDECHFLIKLKFYQEIFYYISTNSFCTAMLKLGYELWGLSKTPNWNEPVHLGGNFFLCATFLYLNIWLCKRRKMV
jgi:hypothetical protein